METPGWVVCLLVKVVIRYKWIAELQKEARDLIPGFVISGQIFKCRF